MRREFYALLGLVGLGLTGLGQDDLALSQLRSVPQHAWQLPGSRPQVGAFVGIPVLSSFHLHLQNDWFHPGMWFSMENGRGIFDPSAFEASLASSNGIGVQESIELLSFGFSTRERKNFWAFSVMQRMELGFALPGDLLRLPWTGNLNGMGPGGKVDWSGFDLAYQQRLEGSLYWHRQWNAQWSTGLRVKGIAGLQHAGLRDVQASWQTDSTDYTWTFNGSGVLETSHVASLWEEENADIGRDIFSREGLNPGWGIDVGVTREGVTGGVTSLHLVDWGQVNWRSGVRNWKLGPGEIVFEGVQLGDILEESDLSSDSLSAWSDAFLDEARETGKLVESGHRFTTALPLRLRIQHRQPVYSTEKVSGGFSVQAQWSPQTDWPVGRSLLGLAWFHERGRNAVSLAASLDRNGALALGTAWSLHLGPFQWYASIDNLLAARLVAFEWRPDGEETEASVVFPYHAPYIQFHTGFQWVFGQNQQIPTGEN